MNPHPISPWPIVVARLAALVVTITACAAAAAWFLAAVARLPGGVVVVTVAVLAFAASWNVTNTRAPLLRAAPSPTFVPVRARSAIR